jgi:hypothetical protein
MSVEPKSKVIRLLKEDEEFRYAVAGLIGLDEILKAIHSLQQQVAENTKATQFLQQMPMEHSKRVEELARSIQALGAILGLLAEESFRSGMKGLIEKYFGGRLESWERYYDEEA